MLLRERLPVNVDEIESIPDVVIQWNGNRYVFSDGKGKISSEFAVRVAQKCGITDLLLQLFRLDIVVTKAELLLIQHQLAIKAYETLEIMAPGGNVNVLKEMLLSGYKPDVEPFLSMMLRTFHGLKFLELRNKARIFVPHGRTMMGCLDETRTLEYGQAFVQVSRMNRDVCLLQAVNVPDLHHVVELCWISTKGVQEVQEYFTYYILNDRLGVIANAHTAFADKESTMVESRMHTACKVVFDCS
ncbi:hypothetical protein IFM89_006891 [Coptis chinensis]|uniref:RNA-dependent RNA polymerase n=1 Tax=Coptis chinensis TaxID=261450 RepID=A0A835GY29_9MAGN|nr:hypothetical protein IFM89_006891 [Coptis chinensis]